MEQNFELYTWQGPNWDITKENRDPSYGPLSWKDDWDRVQPLYLELFKRVGTSHFVWCYHAYKHWKRYEIRRLWVLKVPSSMIFKILDYELWYTMYEDVGEQTQLNKYDWDKLFVERSEGIEKISAGNNNISLLIRVPLCTSIQVIEKNRFNEGSGGRALKYEDLPTSVSDAERYRNEERKKGGFL